MVLDMSGGYGEKPASLRCHSQHTQDKREEELELEVAIIIISLSLASLQDNALCLRMYGIFMGPRWRPRKKVSKNSSILPSL